VNDSKAQHLSVYVLYVNVSAERNTTLLQQLCKARVDCEGKGLVDRLLSFAHGCLLFVIVETTYVIMLMAILLHAACSACVMFLRSV
jgi:hypothetical protein